VPFVFMLKNSNKEKRKNYEFFMSKNVWYGTLSLFWVVTSPFLCGNVLIFQINPPSRTLWDNFAFLIHRS